MGALESILSSRFSTRWYTEMTSGGKVTLLSDLEGELAINLGQVKV